MKLPFRYLRWILLALYVLVVLTLLALSLLEAESDKWWACALGVLLLVVIQAVFLFGAGTIELCKPIRRRRLVFPVAVASLMIAILAGAVSLALMELLRVEEEHWVPYAFFGIVGVSWIAWGILFLLHCRHLDRFRVMKRLTLTVLGGSLLSLLATVPSHIIVARRPGCFVGMHTALGISAGVCVMFWAFGPGIILLFLRERRQRESNVDKNAGERPG